MVSSISYFLANFFQLLGFPCIRLIVFLPPFGRQFSRERLVQDGSPAEGHTVPHGLSFLPGLVQPGKEGFDMSDDAFLLLTRGEGDGSVFKHTFGYMLQPGPAVSLNN